MKRIKSLLVDDEHELISTLVERLDYRDVDADSATSGAEALEILKSNSYDVIVIDLKMPGMSGTDLIRVISHQYPDLPILLMTGHGFVNDDEELPPGIADYLPKPVKIDELVAKMKEVLKQDD